MKFKRIFLIIIMISIVYGVNNWTMRQEQKLTLNPFMNNEVVQPRVTTPEESNAQTFSQKPTKSKVTKIAAPVNVACVFAIGGLGDNSFNDMTYSGLQKAQSDGLCSFVYTEPADITEAEGYFNSYAAAGTYDLIVSVGIGYENAVNDTAYSYPSQAILSLDVEVIQGNVSSALFKEHEGSFLVGAMAGLMTQTGRVGFIGGMDIPLIRKFWAGYKAGALYENNNSYIEVFENFVGAFDNPTTAKNMAEAMWAKGVDIIFAAAGASGDGVLESANEQGEGFYAIGVDSDQDDLYPGHILCSMMKRVDLAVYNAIKDVYDSTWSADVRSLGLAENGVGISPLNYTKERIGSDIIQEVNVTIRNKIISGEIIVPTNSTELTQWLTNMGIVTKSYTYHVPISISSSGQFSALGFTGTGFYNDPYLIEGLYINGTTLPGGTLLEIDGITDYFLIKDNLLNGLYTTGQGIFLKNSRFGTIEGNAIIKTQDGIRLESSDNNTLTDNAIFNNIQYGIVLTSQWFGGSHNNTISHNVISDNDERGLRVWNSTDNSITENVFSDNGGGISILLSNDTMIRLNNVTKNTWDGIYVDSSKGTEIMDNVMFGNFRGIHVVYSERTLIAENTVYLSQEDGIWLLNSLDNVLDRNTVYNNTWNGIVLESASNNTIIDNVILNNVQWGIGIVGLSINSIVQFNDVSGNNAGQAIDQAMNSIFTNNYWSDWIGSGSYAISGTAGNQDPSPLKYPYHLSAPVITAPTTENLTLTGVISIQWNSSIDSFGHSLTYSVFYSTNDGTSWTTIASGLTRTNYTFDTLLIADGSILFKVQTTDSIGFISSFISEATFLIANDQLSPPTILSPNGGEILNETITIEWSASLDSLNHSITYTIYYSGDSGVTWTTIATGLTSTSYAWDTTTVPNGFSYLIKIVATCSEGKTAEDTLDGTFTIENDIPIITSTTTTTTIPSASGQPSIPAPGMTGIVTVLSLIPILVLRKITRKTKDYE